MGARERTGLPILLESGTKDAGEDVQCSERWALTHLVGVGVGTVSLGQQPL